jgi:hypothetical protein
MRRPAPTFAGPRPAQAAPRLDASAAGFPT